MTNGTYLYALAITLTEIIGGFVIGSACGILLGIAMVQVPLLNRIVYPYVVGLQTVPKVAIAPLMIVWFGFGISSKIFIVALTCLFPSLINTIAGLRAVDSDRIALITAMCGTRAQLLRYVQLPNALPYIMAGLNTGIVLAVICHRRRICRLEGGRRRADPAANFGSTRIDVAVLVLPVVKRGAGRPRSAADRDKTTAGCARATRALLGRAREQHVLPQP